MQSVCTHAQCKHPNEMPVDLQKQARRRSVGISWQQA